jgi:hypothetical protein
MRVQFSALEKLFGHLVGSLAPQEKIIMLRPENTHPNDQDVVLRDSDNLETTLASGLPNESDSPSVKPMPESCARPI